MFKGSQMRASAAAAKQCSHRPSSRRPRWGSQDQQPMPFNSFGLLNLTKPDAWSGRSLDSALGAALSTYLVSV